MPIEVANNAVCLGYNSLNDPILFSFGGIDTSLTYSGIHRKCMSYNIAVGEKLILPDLPDTLGKIASAATCIGNRIYVVGGCHVLTDGTEIRSNKVHCFNIDSMKFEADRAPLPVAVSDQVQFRYGEYIVVISGSGNEGALSDIQIYEPAADTWFRTENAFPSDGYAVAGASGAVNEYTDQIFYYSGMHLDSNNTMSKQLRIGTIHSLDSISWVDTILTNQESRFRSFSVVRADLTNEVYWIQGSKEGSGFDALDYNTGIEVNYNYAPTGISYFGESLSMFNGVESGFFEVTDVQGYGEYADGYYTIGGVTRGRQVVPWVLLYTSRTPMEGVEEYIIDLKIKPNPAQNRIEIVSEVEVERLDLYNLNGKIVQSSSNKHMQLEDVSKGLYILMVSTAQGLITKKLVVK